MSCDDSKYKKFQSLPESRIPYKIGLVNLNFHFSEPEANMVKVTKRSGSPMSWPLFSVCVQSITYLHGKILSSQRYGNWITSIMNSSGGMWNNNVRVDIIIICRIKILKSHPPRPLLPNYPSVPCLKVVVVVVGSWVLWVCSSNEDVGVWRHWVQLENWRKSMRDSEGESATL